MQSEVSGCTGSILVLDQDDVFRGSAVRYLLDSGYDVHAGRDGSEALKCSLERPWLAVIIGTEAFGNGWKELLCRVRQRSNVPIVLIGVEMTAGLEAGADACLPKDGTFRPLLACLRAIARRIAMAVDAQQRRSVSEEYVIADLRIAPGPRRATLAGRELMLTSGQFDLLLSLAKAAGRIKSRDDLCAEVSAREHPALGRAIDVQVACLRKKLGDDPKRPRFIRTVRSAGYILAHPDGM